MITRKEHMTEFKNITAHTLPNPPKGYVGYLNFSQSLSDREKIRISMRPDGLEDSGTARFVDMPRDQVVRMAREILEQLNG